MPPEDIDGIEKAERERQVFNPNRCAKCYQLDVQKSIDIQRRDGNISFQIG
jgi:hypothetical protein